MKALLFTVVLGFCALARGDVFDINSFGLRVRVDGVSKEAIGEVKAVIEEQASLTQDKTVTPPLADDLSFFLRQRYLALGYRDAEVTWDVAQGAALLHVKEGLRYTVGALLFKGNHSQNEADLIAYLLRPTHEKLGTVGKRVPFVEVDLRSGAELVARYFQSQGFLSVVVELPVFTARPRTGTVDVALTIKEGPRSVFGTVQVTGELEGWDREVGELLRDLSGTPFNEVTVETVRKGIVGIYEQRGYYAVLVEAKTDAAQRHGGRIAVEYRVVPGAQFNIAEVEISPGFSRGAQRILRSAFRRAAGRVYLPSEVEFMTRRTLDTEIFSRLDVKVKPSSADNTLTLGIAGTEALRTTLSATIGFETFTGPFIGAEARQVNFMDSGNSVRIRAEYTARSVNGGIQWRNPAIFESPFSLEVEIAAQSFAPFDYERRTLNLRTTLKREWNKHVSANVFAEASINSAESESLTLAELGPPEYQLGIVGAGLVLDYRDSPVLPSRGWMANASAAAVSGDVTYVRGDVGFAYYRPITKKIRAAFSAKTSVIQGGGGVESIPIDLRLFNGGANSVRSFPEREMGSRSKSSTPLGGLISQTFSLELSREIIPSLELALFGDAGSLRQTFDEPETLRYAIGLGLRYKLPIGPLRLDYGFNPNPRDDEPSGAAHLTLGFAF